MSFDDFGEAIFDVTCSRAVIELVNGKKLKGNMVGFENEDDSEFGEPALYFYTDDKRGRIFLQSEIKNIITE